MPSGLVELQSEDKIDLPLDAIIHKDYNRRDSLLCTLSHKRVSVMSLRWLFVLCASWNYSDPVCCDQGLENNSPASVSTPSVLQRSARWRVWQGLGNEVLESVGKRTVTQSIGVQRTKRLYVFVFRLVCRR